MKLPATLALLLLSALCPALLLAQPPVPENPYLPATRVVLELPPGPDNPRNSEGSFVQLKDGTLLFAYSHFSGAKGNDDAPADIVSRSSHDGGLTWSKTDSAPLVAREAATNVMSVSLLRLHDGRIALFYIRKDSIASAHIFVRFSSDEGRTWSASIQCIHDAGYYVLNNDRVIQLRSGRIVLPVALHSTPSGSFTSEGRSMVYLSDDGGTTWRRSRTVLHVPTPSPQGLQEPGVVELRDGRLMMFMRTALGSQYLSYSSDGGETWTTPQPSSIQSPLSPATIRRIPSTGDLLLVWNDHSRVDPSLRVSAHSYGKRTPLTVAISRDDGKTWIHVHDISDDPDGCFCYFALAFVRGRVLLATCATGKGMPCLSRLEIVTFPLSSLYK